MQLPAASESGREEFISFDSPIGLLQELLTQHDGSTTIDKLTQSLQRQTGVTWNNRFKKQHGTLGKVCAHLPFAPLPFVPLPLVPLSFVPLPLSLSLLYPSPFVLLSPLCPSPLSPSKYSCVCVILRVIWRLCLL